MVILCLIKLMTLIPVVIIWKVFAVKFACSIVKERLKIFFLDVLPSVRIKTDYDALFACLKPNNKTFLPDNTSTNKKDKDKRTKK